MTRVHEETKRLPVFTLARCKQCGICGHFCPKGAIVFDEHGFPLLAEPDICNSCGLCVDMCPDWAVCLDGPGDGEAE